MRNAPTRRSRRGKRKDFRKKCPSAGAQASTERQLLRALMDNVPDYIYFKDRESRFTRISRGHAKFLGLNDPSEAIGKSDFDFYPQEEAQSFLEDEQRIMLTGEPIVDKEEKKTYEDGRVAWVSTTKEPLRDPQGSIVGTFGVSREITERKQVEQALRDSETRLRKVAETNEEMLRQMTEIIGQVFWLADPSVSRMIYVSPAYEEIWGCKRESLYQSPRSWLEAIHPEDRERVISSLPQPMTKPFAVEYRILRPDGSVRWIADRRFPVRDQSGLIYQVAGVAEDITERKRAEDALARERNLLRTLIETIPDQIYVKDTESRFVIANIAHVQAMCARSEEDIKGKNSFDFLPEEVARRYVADDRIVLETGQPLLNREGSVALPNGHNGWIIGSKVPLCDSQGKVIGLVGIARDITDRKQAEEALARERDLLRALFETIPDRIYVKDKEARFILNNIAHIRSLGARSQEEVTGKTDFDFRPPELAARYFADDKQVLDAGTSLRNREMPGILEGGATGWLRVNKAPLRDSQGQIIGLVGITQDVTDRKRAEDALAYERDLLQGLLDNIPDYVYFKDLQSRFIHISRAQAKHFGLQDPSEAMGKTDFDFFTAEHAQEALDDEQAILRTGQPILNKEEKETHPDGRVTWVSTNKEVLQDPEGKIMGLVGISRDITERKRAETALENLHRQLLDTSRQAGMAEVATNVLHNVGNVLNSMNVSLGLVSDRVQKSRIANLARATGLIQEHKADLAAYLLGDSKGSQLPGYLIQLASHLTGEQADNLKELQLLQGNLEHIKEIVAMQQNYSKIAGVVETLPVAELIEDALRMNTAALSRHEVQVVREYAEVPPVVVERHKVLQILVNLIRNAKYALDEGRQDDRRLTLRVAHNGSDFVHILVIDNGVGISTENLNRIFEHGFTTRKEGHGFGLHSSALAAQEMGGTLTVCSEGVGKGAIFKLSLPTKPKGEDA